MMEQARDFVEESRALKALLADREEAWFEGVTQFKAWTVNDVLRHLHYWNWMAALQLKDEARLVSELTSMVETGMRPRERAFAGDKSGAGLLDAWWNQVERTGVVYDAADPKQRLKWAGPDMSARSSITARLMETWAHGQEVFDHFGVVRKNADRIRNIAVLGVNTFAWTYLVRKEAVPGQMPLVRLTAPSGDIWTYGEPNSSGLVEGLAEEFCQVVTQTRNIRDTDLKVEGAVASDWMSKAQCFAGGPSVPPAPGTRHVQ